MWCAHSPGCHDSFRGCHVLTSAKPKLPTTLPLPPPLLCGWSRLLHPNKSTNSARLSVGVVSTLPGIFAGRGLWVRSWCRCGHSNQGLLWSWGMQKDRRVVGPSHTKCCARIGRGSGARGLSARGRCTSEGMRAPRLLRDDDMRQVRSRLGRAAGA